jgi:polar amino acid transport system substrate-binding protein
MNCHKLSQHPKDMTSGIQPHSAATSWRKALQQSAATVCVLFCCWYSNTARAATSLTFCFQDSELVPYYLGNGAEPNPVKPGATIEHLQQITAKVPAVTLKLVRFPWQRCLKLLKSGEVDAVVANYADHRRELGVFPLRQNQPDPSREFTRQEVCLVTSKAFAKQWNGSSFADIPKIIVAHQAGRSVDQLLAHRQFVRVPISGQAKALQMLVKQKVQVVSMVCKIAGKSALPAGFDAATMQMLEPLVDEMHGHLVFSHQFYQAHQPIAEALWAQLTEPPLAIYLKYLNEESSP